MVEKTHKNITNESPIFVANNTKRNTKYEHLTDTNLQIIINKVIKHVKAPRGKQDNRYNMSCAITDKI